MSNEFIVWNEEEQKFLYYVDFMISHCGDVWRMNNSNEIQSFEKDRYKAFNYIGKTDTEDNKIYADCSIVEFDKYSTIQQKMEYKVRAYFSFSKEQLGYVMKVIKINNVFEEISETDYMIYYKRQVKNLKVIGTLQENKELLDD